MIKRFIFPAASLAAILILSSSCFNQVMIDPMGGLNRDKPLTLTMVYSDHIYSHDQKITYNPADFSKILMIPVEGVISSDDATRRGGANPGVIQEMLQKAILQKDFKAVILKIDSPGGTVHGSDSIYKLILRYRDYTKLPVYAHIEGMGASGGYYVAMAGSHVNAAPSSLVGSIGVILKKYTISGLMEKVGIQYNSVKSGANKDLLAMEKPMSKEEEALIQEQITESYNIFLSVILKSRGSKIDQEALKKAADGRIYTPSQAKKLNLIDSDMYFEDYIEYIKITEKMKAVKVYAYVPDVKKDYNLYNIRLNEPAQPAEIFQSFTEGKRNGLYYYAE
jgi:protease IV